MIHTTNNSGLAKRTSLPFQPVSSLLFSFYCLYLVNFFLHLTSRLPPLALIRLTALAFLITWLLVLSHKSILDKRSTHKVTQALNALLIYLLCSFLLTEYPGSVIKNNLETFLKAISFFYFTIVCVDTPKRFLKVVFLFMALQLFRVLEPLYLNITTGYWGDQTYLGGGFAQRLAGSPHDIINANELGFVIATLIPFIYFLCFVGRSIFAKLSSIVVMALLGYALILTMSRGAFLALCVGMWFVLKQSKSKTTLISLCVIGVICALSVMNDNQRERYLSIFGKSSNEKANSTTDGRLKGIIAEFELGLSTNPIFGNGIGTTSETKANVLGKAQASHNFYAELLIEIGILGAIFFYRFIKQIYLALKKLITYDELKYRRYVDSLFVIFFMYLVYSINYYGLSQSYWYFLGGIVVALSQLINNSEKSKLFHTSKVA